MVWKEELRVRMFKGGCWWAESVVCLVSQKQTFLRSRKKKMTFLL